MEGHFGFVLPVSFGTVPPAVNVWRGVKLNRRLHSFLDKIYEERPGTFVELSYLDASEQTQVCRGVGQAVRGMQETTFGGASFCYFEALRSSLSGLLARGLHVTWLVDFVNVAIWKYQYLDASVRREYWATAHEEADRALRNLREEMTCRPGASRRGTDHSPRGRVAMKAYQES